MIYRLLLGFALFLQGLFRERDKLLGHAEKEFQDIYCGHMYLHQFG